MGRGGRGRGGEGDDVARGGVGDVVGRVDVRRGGQGRWERGGRRGAAGGGEVRDVGVVADGGRGAAVGEGSRDVAGVGGGRVGEVQLGPGLRWEWNVVDAIEDTKKFPVTVVPRESWVVGVGRLGGVEA